MHQTMEIYMARKKRVPSFYNPDSNRVFNGKVTDESLGCTKLNKIYLERKKDPIPPHPRDPERRNCPQPHYSRFLTENARTLNEPICIIRNECAAGETNDWWPKDIPHTPPKAPVVTKDTTQRMDYVEHKSFDRSKLKGKNHQLATSRGIVPVNPPKGAEDPGEILLEKMSFNHNFNSRNPSIQQRGRLHGCFVWDRVVKDSQGKDIIETAWNRGGLEQKQTHTVASSLKPDIEDAKRPKSPSSASTIPHVDGLPPP